MKGFVAAAFLATVVGGPGADRNADAQRLLAKVDVSDPRYGRKTFGSPTVNVFTSRDGSQLLGYQARYGGDGEHTENRLKVFRFQGPETRKLLDQNIDFVSFVVDAGVLKYIRGKYVESLCDTCDGWDAALPEDVFFIPIVIDLETLAVRPELSEEAKQELMARARERSKANLSEQARYGNDEYARFVDSVTRRVEEILRRK